MEWQGVLVITMAILVALFTNRWWLPTLLNTLQGKRIRAKWADKEYALTIDAAKEVIREQQSAIIDDRWGVFGSLLQLPNVTGVEIGPKIVGGQVTGKLAIRVKVRKKLPRFELRAQDIIPATVGDIPVDVVEETNK